MTTLITAATDISPCWEYIGLLSRRTEIYSLGWLEEFLMKHQAKQN